VLDQLSDRILSNDRTTNEAPDDPVEPEPQQEQQPAEAPRQYLSFAKILSQRLDDGPAACEPGRAMSFVLALLGALRASLRARTDLALENLALRQRLALLRDRVLANDTLPSGLMQVLGPT